MISNSLSKKFQEILSEKQILTDEAQLACYSYDASITKHILPDIVVRPENEEQIQKIIQLCNEEDLPVITRGAGTNVSGGSIAVKGGCVLLTTALNKILEINTNDLYAVVEAGVVTSNLANAALEHGLFYPPDPGSMNISTIGGNVAENAGGLRGLKYGVTKDYLMGVNFFDINGNYCKGGGKTVKLVSGFNLPGMMIASEGMFGIMTKFVLKLIPPPAFSKSMLVIFDDILDACNTVSDIISSKILPATLELLDNLTIRSVEDSEKIGLPVDAQALLLIELDGHQAQVEDEFEILKKVCSKNKGSIKIAETSEERDDIWQARRKALSCLARLKPTLVLEDATVPRSRIADMMREIQKIAEKYDLIIGTFGHAGDGNLHPTILTDKRDEKEMEKVEHAIDDIFAAALSMEGTITGEHGVGLAKAKYLVDEVGEGTIEFMRNLKRGIDSKNLLNPHKMNL
jgi:glycolate oxidase